MTLREERLQRADELANHLPFEFSVSGFREAVEKVTPLNPLFREDLAFAATAIAKEDVESFVNNGWMTFYERGVTWHQNWGATEKQARFTRTFNDERLFGDRCLNDCTHAMLCCHGVGGDPGDAFDHLLQYGDYIIVWDDSWKTHGTITWGDSQQNVAVMPYSEENANRLLALHERTGDSMDEALRTGAFEGKRHPYFEVQIHKHLSMENVEGFLKRDSDGEVRQVEVNSFAENQ